MLAALGVEVAPQGRVWPPLGGGHHAAGHRQLLSAPPHQRLTTARRVRVPPTPGRHRGRRALTVRAYVRGFTADRAAHGYGLAAQRTALAADSERRRWDDVEWYEGGGASGTDLDRPALTYLLADVRPGDTVVMSRLDRLSRSLSDFAALMKRA